MKAVHFSQLADEIHEVNPMSRYTKQLVMVSSVLGVLLSLTTLSTTKASALGLEQVIPLTLDKLQERGFKVKPNVKFLEESLNDNNLQLCLLSCSPADTPINPLSLPAKLTPQPQAQNIPLAPRSNPNNY